MSIVSSNYIQLHTIRYKINKQSETKKEEFEYLLLKRNNLTKIYPNIWQVITGTIEKNETAIQTAIREMKEETGLVPLKFWILPYLAKFYERYSDSVQLSPTFIALVADDKVSLSIEHVEYSWLNQIDCINLLTLASHKEATELIPDFMANSHNLQHFQIDLSKY